MPAAGLDFGTSYSALYFQRGQNPDGSPRYEVVGSRLRQTAKQYPSYVKYHQDGSFASCGYDAALVAAAGWDLPYIIYDMKRLIGRKYKTKPKTDQDEKEVKEFEYFIKSLSYRVEEDNHGQISIRIDKNLFTPEKVIADFIAHLLKDGLRQYPEFILDKLVVSVPAYYNVVMREKTKKAAIMAIESIRSISEFRSRIKIEDLDEKRTNEINDVSLISEPTAALVTYASTRACIFTPEEYIMVIDLGAGTLDISIGTVRFRKSFFNPKYSIPDLDIISIHGNNNLGGRRMDEKITQWAENEILNTPSYGITQISPELRHELKKEVETAKIRLTDTEETNIYLSSHGIQLILSRTLMEELIVLLVDVLKKEIEAAIRKANIDKKDIALVIPVGGPTQMPCIKRIIQEDLGLPLLSDPGWDPLLCVAEGAARSVGLSQTEVIPYDVYASVSFFGSIVVPFKLCSAGTPIPYNNKTAIKVQRYPTRAIYKNLVHIVEGHDGLLRSVNQIRVPCASGKGSFIHDYQYNCGVFQFHTLEPRTLRLNFDDIELSYTITKEHLISCKFRDLKINTILNLSEVYADDLGTVEHTGWDRFQHQCNGYASEYFSSLDRDIEHWIREEMQSIRASSPDKNEQTLREEAEKKVLTELNEGYDEEKMFQALRQRVKDAIDRFEQWSHGQPKNYWAELRGMKKRYHEATVDTEFSRVNLENIISEIEIHMNVRLNE